MIVCVSKRCNITAGGRYIKDSLYFHVQKPRGIFKALIQDTHTLIRGVWSSTSGCKKTTKKQKNPQNKKNIFIAAAWWGAAHFPQLLRHGLSGLIETWWGSSGKSFSCSTSLPSHLANGRRAFSLSLFQIEHVLWQAWTQYFTHMHYSANTPYLKQSCKAWT